MSEGFLGSFSVEMAEPDIRKQPPVKARNE
jgi:hypothetical protein